MERDTLTDNYGRFVIEPFERGFGHTIGNGLRRILLSTIEGTAVRWFRMTGALHEFQSVDGIVEDVTDIVLQVKQLLVRIPGEDPVTLRIEKKGKGPVTAADITPEGDAEIVNPDLHLCTLAKSMKFEMELEAAKGRGYVTAEENEAGGGRHSEAGARRNRREVEQEIGKIWVDSVFSPVLRVKYATEDTRVGRLTDYDKLLMDIWTDGSVKPEEALTEAAKIYRKFLNPLVAYGTPGAELPEGMRREEVFQEGSEEEDERLREIKQKPISELDLSVRSNNCLEAEKIFTVGDLMERSEQELLQVRNFGKTSLHEINAKLAELGVSLAEDSEPSEDEQEQEKE